jgi:uncharacterized protein (DUF4415 family)
MPDSEINYSDIPRLTDAEMRRVSLRREAVRNPQMFSLELDPDVTAWLQSLGKRARTRVNAILRAAMTSDTPKQ